MSHVRRQIRERVAMLLDARPALSGRVYVNPRTHFADDQLPVAVISTPLESIESIFARKEHSLSVSVELVAMSDATADDLDQLAIEVELALASDSLEGFVADWRHTATQLAFDQSRKQVAGSAKLTFYCLYHTSVGNPEETV